VKHKNNQLCLSKDSLNEASVVCAIAGEWKKLTCQSMVSCQFIGTSHERSKSLALNFLNVETVLY
jgi:hypothetical protein